MVRRQNKKMTNYDKIINVKPNKIRDYQKNRYYKKKKSENRGFILDIYLAPLANYNPNNTILSK